MKDVIPDCYIDSSRNGTQRIVFAVITKQTKTTTTVQPLTKDELTEKWAPTGEVRVFNDALGKYQTEKLASRMCYERGARGHYAHTLHFQVEKGFELVREAKTASDLQKRHNAALDAISQALPRRSVQYQPKIDTVLLLENVAALLTSQSFGVYTVFSREELEYILKRCGPKPENTVVLRGITAPNRRGSDGQEQCYNWKFKA